jgi:cell division protein FtsN
MDMKLMTQSKQRGGTMLGIIVGVLVGLGAALAVAVYVTKVPVPFVNKGANKGSAVEQEAAEAKKNKDWDPNAPLYGKNPAKSGTPATGGSVGAEPAATAPAPGANTGTPTAAVTKKPAAVASGAAGAEAAKPAKAASAATASAVPAKPGTADPLGDLAKAKSAAAAAAGSTTGGADPFTYLVQAGAFRTPEDAETQRAKLGMLGMEAKVTEREQSGHTVYRVRVGPFGNKDEAEKAKDKLDSSGFDTALVRVQR